MQLSVGQGEDRSVLLFHPCPSEPGCPYCAGSPPPGGFDWSFLGGAYCISLASRPDRATSAAEQLHKVGLCRLVTFYRPTRHPKSPKIGIWESHRAVALDALEKGLETVLVLEDDVRFARFVRPRTVRAVQRALARLPQDWMIFFLGHWVLRAWFVRPNVLRSASACTHAYIASRRLLTWLRDHPFGTAPIVRIAGTGIDAAFAALPGTYAYFPMLATQTASRSDHLTYKPGRKKAWKLKHLFTRSRFRERMLSGLMRPNELAIVALSPLFYLIERLRGPLLVRPATPPLSDPALPGRQRDA
ncbi:hypothetical protein [Benzoatithermus flavus]|uniref:Uncharacterized protein n=1 Tax=Benzoatithermus flavus TaxID=3108223 RepID=A0ABU8XQQ2_9PROT